MAKIQRKVREFLAIAAALATGGCSLETTSEKREFGESDSASKEQDSTADCVSMAVCGEYTCGLVPDGCGGEISCGDPYGRDPIRDYPYGWTGAGCTVDHPYNWRCGAPAPGGPAPRDDCILFAAGSSSTWCCTESS